MIPEILFAEEERRKEPIRLRKVDESIFSAFDAIQEQGKESAEQWKESAEGDRLVTAAERIAGSLERIVLLLEQRDPKVVEAADELRRAWKR